MKYTLIILAFMFGSCIFPYKESNLDKDCYVIDTTQCKKSVLFVANNIDSFEFYYKKKYIPKLLRKKLIGFGYEKIRLRNPSRNYRRTDVIPFLGLVPNSRLIFVAKYENYSLISYITGGRGLYSTCIIAKHSQDSIEDIYYIGFGGFKNKEEFIDLLNKRNIYVINDTYIIRKW